MTLLIMDSNNGANRHNSHSNSDNENDANNKNNDDDNNENGGKQNKTLKTMTATAIDNNNTNGLAQGSPGRGDSKSMDYCGVSKGIANSVAAAMELQCCSSDKGNSCGCSCNSTARQG